MLGFLRYGARNNWEPYDEPHPSVNARKCQSESGDRIGLLDRCGALWLHCGMEYAGIRELRNNLSRYLRKLKPGHVIAVTDRGRVVAELCAPGDKAGEAPLPQGYARLLAQGAIHRAREKGDPLGKLVAGRAGAAPRGTVAALIHEDRGD